MKKNFDAKKNKVSIFNCFNIYKENGNEVKLILKGKSDLRIPFNNYRAYLQEAFYYENKNYNLNAFVSFKDITYEDKNLGSLKCGLIKKIRIGGENNNAFADNVSPNNAEENIFQKLKQTLNDYYSNLEGNSISKKTENNNYLDLSLGFKLDRPLYGVCTSNNFSNRNFINFILGLENNKFSFLTKLKYADYDRSNLIGKSFFKLKLSEKSSVFVDFYFDEKNHITKYNFGAEEITDDSNIMRLHLNEKNQISQQVTLKYNDQIKFNFKYCVSLANGFTHPQENQINPELYLDAKFGMGIEYTNDTKIGNNGVSLLNNSVNENEKGFGHLVFESVNSVYNSVLKFIRTIDIY